MMNASITIYTNKCRTCSKETEKKFCSKDCYYKSMSLRNSLNNKQRNKIVAEENYENILPLIKEACEFYINKNNTLTLKEVSKKFNVYHSSLRKYCSENNLIRNDLLYISKEKNLKKKSPLLFQENIFKKLNEQDLTCEEASLILNVSPNTVAVYARKAGEPIKYKTTSQYERKISNFLGELNINHQSNSRILDGKEIDIFVPDRNFGIEINGCYWHTEKQGKDKNYHLNKYNLAKEKEIELISFYDYELDSSFDIIKSIILNKIGMNKTKIQARKLIIKQISKEEAKEFLDNNHLHGYIPSKINIGGYYNNELVCVGAFNGSRFSKTEWELTRFSIKKFTSIKGSFERIFNYFIKTQKPNSIVSYCHVRLFSGEQYKNAGFELSHINKPGYFWFKDGEILTRYQTQKHKLNTNLTEKEHMEQLGFSKVWDCGQKVFIWRKKT